MTRPAAPPPPPETSMGSGRPCRICGDPEPVHVHNGDKRIEDYFTVGRGESEMQAALRWQERARRAEAVLCEVLPGWDMQA